MRQVLSISLPAMESQALRRLAKKRGFSSISAYIKELFTADKELISDTELLENVRLARAEYRAGKSIRARSLANLL